MIVLGKSAPNLRPQVVAHGLFGPSVTVATNAVALTRGMLSHVAVASVHALPTTHRV